MGHFRSAFSVKKIPELTPALTAQQQQIQQSQQQIQQLQQQMQQPLEKLQKQQVRERELNKKLDRAIKLLKNALKHPAPMHPKTVLALMRPYSQELQQVQQKIQQLQQQIQPFQQRAQQLQQQISTLKSQEPEYGPEQSPE